MKPVTHIQDTSARLAHFFDEPGAVENLWTSGSGLHGINAVTIAELWSILRDSKRRLEGRSLTVGGALRSDQPSRVS